MCINIEKVKAYIDCISHPKLVGIRQILQSEEDVWPFYLQSNYLKSLEFLAEQKLIFEICIYSNQLHHINKLVSSTPNNKYILDHLAKPFVPSNNDNFDEWSKNINKLSINKNVFCKLSVGFTTRNKTLEQVKPYIEHCIECFGHDRLIVGSLKTYAKHMFLGGFYIFQNGSDWLFSNDIVTPYDWFNFLLNILQEKNISNEIIRQIFYDNAEKIYIRRN
jgi:predicted TIM-barrel fold metal-dependent hydrolase